MLSIARTPLSTRLLNGQETNSLLGSRRMTSIDGSPSRTYFAAVAPPQPPPITTTRLPVFGAKSPCVAVAHPPSTPTATPIPVVRRNCLRVTLITLIPAPSASVHGFCGRPAAARRSVSMTRGAWAREDEDGLARPPRSPARPSLTPRARPPPTPPSTPPRHPPSPSPA